jgi:phosphoglycolate phosphatase-like HAD superfamily hydrolase
MRISDVIKCVVFDFDGTLVHSNDIKREAFFAIARPWDPSGDIVTEVYDRWPAADRYEKTRRIAQALVDREMLPAETSVEDWGERLADDYTSYCENAITVCPEMPGATLALRELTGRGLSLYVNSGTPTDPLQQLIVRRGWAPFFRAVYGAEASKADNLRKASRDSGAARHEIVHVGDQLDDLRGAEQFGCHFVAMFARGALSTVKETPLHLEDLRSLPGLLDRLAGESS